MDVGIPDFLNSQCILHLGRINCFTQQATVVPSSVADINEQTNNSTSADWLAAALGLNDPSTAIHIWSASGALDNSFFGLVAFL